MTVEYKPLSTWIHGQEYANPSGREAWRIEVDRLLTEAIGHEAACELYRRVDQGAIPGDYDEWWQNPAEYVVRLLTQFSEAAPVEPEVVEKLWKLKTGARKAAARPFIGHRVALWRWYGRVAANGDQQYVGRVVAIATSTIGSSADLLILHTDEGNTWAISLAQIARLEAL
jgi:hypothetical protein